MPRVCEGGLVRGREHAKALAIGALWPRTSSLSLPCRWRRECYIGLVQVLAMMHNDASKALGAARGGDERKALLLRERLDLRRREWHLTRILQS
eukprot:2727547-Prymnesium_polylepis.1